MSPELSFKKAGKEYKADLPDKTGFYEVDGLGIVRLDFSKIDPRNPVNILIIKTFEPPVKEIDFVDGL